MPILRCKMCGGDLNISSFDKDTLLVECSFCGTKQTIPSADSEKKINLFNRAIKLLRLCEFDKASGVYESIIADYPEEAEAYWGLVLCKYGIEYVDDPNTEKKIPTCHRSSFDSVLDDPNLELAIENSEATCRTQYREEAKKIEKLRQRIVEVSSKEDPYDIFICYKETDENGNRTVDSVIAQDVYTALTEKGYRVFFSRISLEDKLGIEYEPYIFSALNSSKIMLVFGTNYEYFNAVWTKNEWSRFLQLIEKGNKKTLIPCYKGIDAYDIPKEFAKLQALDMGRIGAIQDLLRGIEKILPKHAEPITLVSSTASAVEPILKRAFIFLEDGNWKNADEYCEKALDIDPENATAYVGKLMADLHVHKQSDLANCEEPFDDDLNFKKVLRFGDKKTVSALMGYIEAIKQRTIDSRLSAIYDEASKYMNNASLKFALLETVTFINNYINGEISGNIEEKFDDKALRISRYEDTYIKASALFKSINEYKDSAGLAIECSEKSRELERCKKYLRAKRCMFAGTLRQYENALNDLASIRGWKDSDKLAEQCQLEIEKLRKVEKENIEIAKKAKEIESQRTLKAREIEVQNKARIEEAIAKKKKFKERGVCQYCGGNFKGILTKKCSVCGKPKDY